MVQTRCQFKRPQCARLGSAANIADTANRGKLEINENVVFAPASELLKGGGEFVNGIEEEVGFCGAEAFFGGEGAQDGDGGADAGAAGHFEVFRGVAYVGGFRGAEVHVAKRETEWSGVGFTKASVAAADAGGEAVPEFKFMELTVDAVAVAAGDQAEGVVAGEMGEHAASAGEKLGTVVGVVFAPDLVGGVPLIAREICGAINVVPVGGIVLFEFGDAPGDLHFSEHSEVGGGVCGVGVEESAVPVEEDAAKGARSVGGFHWIALSQFSVLAGERPGIGRPETTRPEIPRSRRAGDVAKEKAASAAREKKRDAWAPLLPKPCIVS